MSAFGFRSNEMLPRLSVHNDPSTPPTTMTARRPAGRMTPMLLRALMFAACVAIGIVGFTLPKETAETITTLDGLSTVDESVDAFIGALGGTTGAASAAAALRKELPPTNSLITVFVRMMSTLILLAAGGLFGPSRNIAATVAVLVDYVLALVFFVYLSVEDDGEILNMWFVVCYATLGCGVPLLAVAYELLSVLPVCA